MRFRGKDVTLLRWLKGAIYRLCNHEGGVIKKRSLYLPLPLNGKSMRDGHKALETA